VVLTSVVMAIVYLLDPRNRQTNTDTDAEAKEARS
jgi:hypothetical protein